MVTIIFFILIIAMLINVLIDIYRMVKEINIHRKIEEELEKLETTRAHMEERNRLIDKEIGESYTKTNSYNDNVN